MKPNNPYSSNKKLYLQKMKNYIYYKYGELDLSQRKYKEERGTTHEKGDRKNNIINNSISTNISNVNTNNARIRN